MTRITRTHITRITRMTRMYPHESRTVRGKIRGRENAVRETLPDHPGSHEQVPPSMQTPCTHPPTCEQSFKSLQFLPSHLHLIQGHLSTDCAAQAKPKSVGS